MNAADRKRLEEINNTPGSGHPAYCSCTWCVDRLWLITHLETEAQENEYYQCENYGERIVELLKVRECILKRAEAAETKVKKLETEARTWRSPQQILRLDAEAICQSLIDQSSRWEAQALEAGVRIAELEALFALQQTRMAEVVKAWRKATGKDTSPDLGDLLAWLMDRSTALEARVRELREAIKKTLDYGFIGENYFPIDGRYDIIIDGSYIDYLRVALAKSQDGKEKKP